MAERSQSLMKTIHHPIPLAISVMAWYRQVKAADCETPADAAIRSASILKDGHVAFNLAGNKYRIVVWISYAYRIVYIRFIATHGVRLDRCTERLTADSLQAVQQPGTHRSRYPQTHRPCETPPR